MSPNLTLDKSLKRLNEFPSRGRAEQFVCTTRQGPVPFRQTHGTMLNVLLFNQEPAFKVIFDQVLDGPLAKKYRILLFDFRQLGGICATAETMAKFAEAALEILECLDIDHAVAIGDSLGSLIAMELATIFPGLLGIAQSEPENVKTGFALPGGTSVKRNPDVYLLDSLKSRAFAPPTPVLVSSIELPRQASRVSLFPDVGTRNMSIETVDEYLKRSEALLYKQLTQPTLWYGG